MISFEKYSQMDLDYFICKDFNSPLRFCRYSFFTLSSSWQRVM